MIWETLTNRFAVSNSWEQNRLSKSPTNKPRENYFKPLFFAEVEKKKKL